MTISSLSAYLERLLRCAVAALVLAVLLDCTVYSLACDTLPEQVLRLHVVAASDTQEDQALKLAVRDAVLAVAAELCEGADTPFAMQSALCTHMERLQAAAEETLRAAGNKDTVRVFFTDMAFPVCEYGGVTLPAGEYRALRVVIGAGEGHNWWCMLFPSLCLPCGQGVSMEDTLSPAQQDAVSREGITVRFKLVEWLREAMRGFPG